MNNTMTLFEARYRAASMRKRLETAEITAFLENLAEAISQHDMGDDDDLEKWDESQHPRGEGGKFVAAKVSMSKKVVDWVTGTGARTLLLRSAMSAAAIAGIEIPEHAALHRVIHEIINHVGIEGALAASAITVIVKKTAHALGIDAHMAKRFLGHVFHNAAKMVGVSVINTHGRPKVKHARA